MKAKRAIDPDVVPFADIIDKFRADLQKTNGFETAPQPKAENTERVGLTAGQRDVLVFIREYNDAHGVSPSYREIMQKLGMKSTAQAHWFVHKLEDRGYVRLRPACARSIEVLA